MTAPEALPRWTIAQCLTLELTSAVRYECHGDIVHALAAGAQSHGLIGARREQRLDDPASQRGR